MKSELGQILLSEMQALALGNWEQLLQILERKAEILKTTQVQDLDLQEATFCWRRNREILQVCQLADPKQRAYGPPR
jgi:hypothetical protein